MEMGRMDSERPERFPTVALKIMSKARILKNLIVLCVGFLCLFTAYQALTNLQSTLNVEDNPGIAFHSVIYATLIVSSLYLPKLVIKKLGCKLTLFFSILTYGPYVASYFNPHMKAHVPTAILLGLGAPLLWSATCTYINEISAMYSTHGADSVDVITSKFFGIFFMFFQSTHIWGSLASFFVLKSSENATEVNANTEDQSFSYSHIRNIAFSGNGTCGINFRNGTVGNLEPPSDDTRRLIIGLYLGCVILGAAIIALFLDPLKRKEARDGDGIFSPAIATIKHMMKPQQFYLVPLTVFIGIEQAFILGDYIKAYLECAWGVYSVGLVLICFGVANAIMSFLTGHAMKYVSRTNQMLIGAAGNVFACIAMNSWIPSEKKSIYGFVIVGVWGLSDAIWQTQMNALYGVLFRSEEEAAFANYRLWESVGFLIALAYRPYLVIAAKISILLAFLLLGLMGYMKIELDTNNHDSSINRDSYIATDPESENEKYTVEAAYNEAEGSVRTIRCTRI